MYLLDQHLSIGLIVDDSIAITSNTATIEWNTYTNLDQSQFNQYIIKLKKRYTEENFETPLILLTTSNSYDLTDLEVAMDYEVWVKVDTIDFGQSEWSESLYFTTPATSNSEDVDIQQLIDEIVRFFLDVPIMDQNMLYLSIYTSFLWGQPIKLIQVVPIYFRIS